MNRKDALRDTFLLTSGILAGAFVIGGFAALGAVLMLRLLGVLP